MSKGIIQVLHHKAPKEVLPEEYCQETFDQVRAFHRTLKGYEESPLVRVSSLAKELGVKEVFVKDESKRFGLNAFKGLGASYAVNHALSKDPTIETVVTATDGNHGKAVAWAARERGLKSVIFMPAGTATARSQAIRDIGNSTVTVTDVNYAGAVAMATKYAEENNGTLVQDTAVGENKEMAEKVTIGYTTMAAEGAEQLEALGLKPTHVFLQAGVGSMAAGVLGYYAARYGKDVTFAVIEELNTACIYESVAQDKVVAIDGIFETTMAGLNCGEPNVLILPLLKEFAEFYIRCNDQVTFNGMRRLAGISPNSLPEEKIVSGECGGVGTGVLMGLMTEDSLKEYKEKMGLGPDSVVLLFSTEGNTDPDHYKEIVEA